MDEAFCIYWGFSIHKAFWYWFKMQNDVLVLLEFTIQRRSIITPQLSNNLMHIQKFCGAQRARLICWWYQETLGRGRNTAISERNESPYAHDRHTCWEGGNSGLHWGTASWNIPGTQSTTRCLWERNGSLLHFFLSFFFLFPANLFITSIPAYESKPVSLLHF